MHGQGGGQKFQGLGVAALLAAQDSQQQLRGEFARRDAQDVLIQRLRLRQAAALMQRKSPLQHGLHIHEANIRHRRKARNFASQSGGLPLS